MKTPALLLLLIATFAVPLAAADADFSAVKKADDARVAAIMASDVAGMSAVLSDDLAYTHSSGKVDGKASFIASVKSGATRYLTFDYEERKFESAAPEIVLVRGRLRAHVQTGGRDENNYLGFLSVYRRERGVWRLLAWQSCKLTAASPPFLK